MANDLQEKFDVLRAKIDKHNQSIAERKARRTIALEDLKKIGMKPEHLSSSLDTLKKKLKSLNAEIEKDIEAMTRKLENQEEDE